MTLDTVPNGWSALIAFFGMVSAIGVIVGPIVADHRARSVKADLAAAAKDVKADLARNHVAAVDSIRATEEGTQELMAKTAEIHKVVNGQSEAKEARIRELEAEVAALKKRKK